MTGSTRGDESARYAPSRLRRPPHLVALIACTALCLPVAASADYALANIPVPEWASAVSPHYGSAITQGDGVVFRVLGNDDGFFRDSAAFWTETGGTVEAVPRSYSTIGAVSSVGQVVGHTYLDGGGSRAFSWTPTGGLVDLDRLGSDRSSAQAVNEAGQVVGYHQYIDDDGGSRAEAFLWSADDGFVDLSYPGATLTLATEVNNAGQVAGWYRDPDGRDGIGTLFPFFYTADEGFVDLRFPGSDYALPRALNDSGQVVGIYTDPDDGNRSTFSWTTEGGFIGLRFPDSIFTDAPRLSETGRVFGRYLRREPGQYSVSSHAYSWSADGGFTDLSRPNSTSESVSDWNALDQTVGSYRDRVSGRRSGFLWSAGRGLTDLQFPGSDYTSVVAISDAGQVVGTFSRVGEAGYRAFSWTADGGFVDLNDAVAASAPPGLVLTVAYALSEQGSILADSNAGLFLLSDSAEAPVVGPVQASDPVAVGEALDVHAGFTDSDASDTHVATWQWSDGSAGEDGSIAGGTVTGSHVFEEAGIYGVRLEIVDSSGLSAAVERDVVVYDPSAGFVTGGGWIDSPPGAYREDEHLAGRATFGFVSKYKKGATVPSGTTEFRFQAADLAFFSDEYEWLVVSGATARYKGHGAINGEEGYRFMLNAVDGALLGQQGNDGDRFRIKIWREDEDGNEIVVYDNQLDAAEEDTAHEGTLIGGGSIVVHTGKGRRS